MKKTVALLLAVIIAAAAMLTMSVCVFADNDDPTDPLIATTAAPTTAAPTTAAPATTAAPTTAAPTTVPATAAPSSTASAQPVTNKEGVTAIDDGPTTRATRIAAPVEDVNPSTGSSIAVPAVALLAFAVGAAAVVKTKKED